MEIPESLVTEYGPEQDMSGAESPAQTTEESAVGQVATTPKVRPVQMGEFLRKWVSRRLMVLNSGDVSRVMMAMRQLGVGVSAGAEALAFFHQTLFEIWKAGELVRPLARIKVDEKNCFGMLEWKAVRQAAKESLPRQSAVTCWKHQAPSHVEQEGVHSLPKRSWCGAG